MDKNNQTKVHRIDCQPIEKTECCGCKLAECYEVMRMLISELKYNPQRDGEDKEQIEKVIKRALFILPEFSSPDPAL